MGAQPYRFGAHIYTHTRIHQREHPEYLTQRKFAIPLIVEAKFIFYMQKILAHHCASWSFALDEYTFVHSHKLNWLVNDIKKKSYSMRLAHSSPSDAFYNLTFRRFLCIYIYQKCKDSCQSHPLWFTHKDCLLAKKDVWFIIVKWWHQISRWSYVPMQRKCFNKRRRWRT